jgi:hypothetical protein
VTGKKVRVSRGSIGPWSGLKPLRPNSPQKVAAVEKGRLQESAQQRMVLQTPGLEFQGRTDEADDTPVQGQERWRMHGQTAIEVCMSTHTYTHTHTHTHTHTPK